MLTVRKHPFGQRIVIILLSVLLLILTACGNTPSTQSSVHTFVIG